MKKVTILFLALFLMFTVADASTWIVKPSTIVFNDCPLALTVVRHGLNYITSGEHQGQASVYVTVFAKSSVLFGCAYYKVYTTNGVLIFKARKRIKLFEGSEQNYFAYVPAVNINGADIRADIGLGCDCSKPGF